MEQPTMGSRDRIAQLAAEIDGVVDAPVLVIGSAPPGARDLDLLAREHQFSRISSHLDGSGFVPWRSTWARFEPGAVLAVELFRADEWDLGSDGAHDALFTGASPLPGLEHLARPAPHVVLVLVARSLLRRRGRLAPSGRRRAVEASEAGAGTWDDARDLARRLGLSGALEMLGRALARPAAWSLRQRVSELARVVVVGPAPTRPTLVRSLVPRLRRPVLVSLSGPDGSGKSTQAAQLQQTLGDLGVVTDSAWVPTTTRPPLPAPVRSFADRSRHTSAGDPAAPDVRPRPPVAVPLRVRLAEHAWITTVALSNAAKMWSHVSGWPTTRVRVLDRFVLDADVKLTYWYGLRRGADITFERRLFRAVSPRTDVAVLLAVSPETNHERRPDEWGLDQFRHFQRIYAETARDFGAVVVDADRPFAQVARDVAEIVWRRLP